MIAILIFTTEYIGCGQKAKDHTISDLATTEMTLSQEQPHKFMHGLKSLKNTVIALIGKL